MTFPGSQDVVDYFYARVAAHEKSCPANKLILMTYIADGLMLAQGGKLLSPEEPVHALRPGPVPVYSQSLMDRMIGAPLRPDPWPFTETQKQVLESVCKRHGHQSLAEIEKFCMSEGSPWAEAWEREDARDENGALIIPKIRDDLTAAFFAGLLQTERAQAQRTKRDSVLSALRRTAPLKPGCRP